MAGEVDSLQFGENSDGASPEGHDEAMLSRFEQQDGEDADQPQGEQPDSRPEWLPDKFKTPEDMAKAYSELEKSFTKQRQQDQQPEKPQTQEQPSQQPEKADEKPTLNSLLHEFHEKGGVSKETLEALNMTPDEANRYIQGQNALIAQMQKDAHELVGGKDNFEAMMTWGEKNLSPAQKQAFDAAVEAGPEVAKIAIAGVFSQYRAAGEPSIVRGDSSGGDDLRGFADVDEYMEALHDPRYDKSEAYRKKVMMRLSRSKNI